MAFDETLKFINEQSGHMNVHDLLRRTQILFAAFQAEFAQFIQETKMVDQDIKTQMAAMNTDHSRATTTTTKDDETASSFVMVDQHDVDQGNDQSLNEFRSKLQEQDVLELLFLLNQQSK